MVLWPSGSAARAKATAFWLSISSGAEKKISLQEMWRLRKTSGHTSHGQREENQRVPLDMRLNHTLYQVYERHLIRILNDAYNIIA